MNTNKVANNERHARIARNQRAPHCPWPSFSLSLSLLMLPLYYHFKIYGLSLYLDPFFQARKSSIGILCLLKRREKENICLLPKQLD